MKVVFHSAMIPFTFAHIMFSWVALAVIRLKVCDSMFTFLSNVV